MISRPFLIRTLNFRTCQCKSSLQLNKPCRVIVPIWRNYKEFHSTSLVYKLRKNIREKIISSDIDRKKNVKSVKVWNNITVEELATATDCDVDNIISLMPEDVNTTDIKPSSPINSQSIVVEILKKLGKKCQIVSAPTVSTKTKEKKDVDIDVPTKPKNLVKRPPVVTVMGHVDHGKTTLLDALRNTFVVEQEFGGITQHIGAFSVDIRPGEKITFIDTPGHAAFSAMRSRGAEVTDLVVLVIAADDGIMQQTIESIRIVKKAGVNMIIAVNKIDKNNAKSVETIKNDLLQEGVQVEDKGGTIQLVPISALKKINLDLLTDMILLEAEVMDLKADPTGSVKGVVIESKKDKQGMLATVIVKQGTLKKGKILVAGKSHARVRNMFDENGIQFNEAPPSTPVQVLGWRELPSAGDKVTEVFSEKEALALIRRLEKEEITEKQEKDKSVIEEKLAKQKELNTQDRLYLKSCKSFAERKKFLFERRKRFLDIQESGPSVKLIVKGDVHGSLEVLLDVLNSYEQDDECELSIVDASIGDVTLNDVELAETFQCIIYAFNVNIHPSVSEQVKEKKIDVRFHNILYKLIDDLKAELNSNIPPVDTEEVIGEGEIILQFDVSVKKKKVPVAGSRCLTGNFKKDSLFKIVRGNDVLYTGKLISMKHLKNEVNTIKKGVECGLMFDSFIGNFAPGDKVICYNMIKVQRTTTWDPGF